MRLLTTRPIRFLPLLLALGWLAVSLSSGCGKTDLDELPDSSPDLGHVFLPPGEVDEALATDAGRDGKVRGQEVDVDARKPTVLDDGLGALDGTDRGPLTPESASCWDPGRRNDGGSPDGRVELPVSCDDGRRVDTDAGVDR